MCAMACVGILDSLLRIESRTFAVSAKLRKLFMEAGIIVLTAFISPFREDRDKVRAMVNSGVFIEIYCQCPIDVCEQRDVKGLYKKARDGEISEFTGNIFTI